MESACVNVAKPTTYWGSTSWLENKVAVYIANETIAHSNPPSLSLLSHPYGASLLSARISLLSLSFLVLGGGLEALIVGGREPRRWVVAPTPPTSAHLCWHTWS